MKRLLLLPLLALTACKTQTQTQTTPSLPLSGPAIIQKITLQNNLGKIVTDCTKRCSGTVNLSSGAVKSLIAGDAEWTPDGKEFKYSSPEWRYTIVPYGSITLLYVNQNN